MAARVEELLRFGVLVVSVLVLSLAVSSFAQVVVLKASLGDASYQTDDTLGQATLVVDGARVVYDINLFFAGGISSAVITRLNETLPTIDLHGSSSNTRASGVVTVAAPQASALMANPTSFVVRIAASGGDLIVAIDGEVIRDFSDLLSHLLKETEVGQEIIVPSCAGASVSTSRSHSTHGRRLHGPSPPNQPTRQDPRMSTKPPGLWPGGLVRA